MVPAEAFQPLAIRWLVFEKHIISIFHLRVGLRIAGESTTRHIGKQWDDVDHESLTEGTRIFFVNSRRPLDEPSVPVSKSHNSPVAVFGGLLSKPVSIVSCGTHPGVVLTVSRFGAL